MDNVRRYYFPSLSIQDLQGASRATLDSEVQTNGFRPGNETMDNVGEAVGSSHLIPSNSYFGFLLREEDQGSGAVLEA